MLRRKIDFASAPPFFNTDERLTSVKILLAGDSTVAYQPREENFNPGLVYCGWGQMLERFMHDTQIINFAVSGYTVTDFREKGQYDRLRGRLSGGDYVLFQFGHNDQKRPELRAQGGYADGLRRYAAEIREYGGKPVFVTPVARNSWNGISGEYMDLLAGYADAMKDVAHEENVPLIDLHDASIAWIISLGREGAKRYFYPGDFTHPNDYGGYKWAKMIAGLILQSYHNELDELKKAVIPMEQWEEYDIGASQADPTTGWLYPPKSRADFAKFACIDVLAVAQALEMARVGYGWFNTEETDLSPPLSDLSCAIEYSYLPDSLYLPFGFPENDFNKPITANQFRIMMLRSCSGRNIITDEAANLHIAGKSNTVTGKSAVDYALKLEKLMLGAHNEPNSNELSTTPKGG